MISPLGQRQIFQTANVEAVRQAQEVSEQIQRENVRKRVADERLLEDEASVQVIANGSSQLRGSSLDFASNLIGAALGAWVTDRYILAPVVVRDAAGHARVGVALKMDF